MTLNNTIQYIYGNYQNHRHIVQTIQLLDHIV